MTDNDAALLPAVVALAHAAGTAILEVYETDFEARQKADRTPVTEADLRAEAAILPGLAALTPELPIVAEERVAACAVPDVSGGTFWLVDPLDGTRDFIARNGEFCVAIGLIRDGVPVLGVLHGPAAGVTYAGAGDAATVDRGDRPVPIATRAPRDDGLTVLVSRQHDDPAQLDKLLADMAVAERRPLGSALKFGAVAEGRADLYPRLGPTMEWDTCAGHAILIAAGGRLETLDGTPFTYGKPGFRNPGFVAYAR